MFPFVETIRVCEGKAENLSYHERRMQQTQQEHWGYSSQTALETLIADKIQGKTGVFKCRIEYRQDIEQIELIPYIAPVIRNLMIVENNQIEYAYKSTDRSALNKLKAQAGNCSDALIIRNGLVTDTTFCNVALFDGYHWITPAHPLLKGTKRAQLLDRAMLIERDIPASMIHEFQLIMLFNAMNEFGSILLPTHEIYRPAD